MSRIFLLPGMGATSDMYRDCSFPSDVITINWIPTSSEMDLRIYSQVIARHYGISVNDMIGGSSFGGMVAASIMGIVGCKKLILIGSCLSPGHIQPLLFKSATFGSLFPFKMGLSVSGYNSMPFISRMAHGQGSFINWACGALSKWPGEYVARQKISHIHGDKDWIIPISRVNPTQVERGCGHLVAMDRPVELSNFIASQKNG